MSFNIGDAINSMHKRRGVKSLRNSASLSGQDQSTIDATSPALKLSGKVADTTASTNGLRNNESLSGLDKSTSYVAPPPLKLSGRVAVITASTDGIGLGIAERLSQDGARVVISSRKEENVAKALEYLKSKGHTSSIGTVCHVSNKQHRAALLQTAINNFGKIDILVSNAATNPGFGSILECTEEAWDKVFDINVKCSFLLAKEVLPYMKQNGGGSILFISSLAGFIPSHILGPYGVSKTALLGLTKACSLEMVEHNIRVNCLAPGVIDTKFAKSAYDRGYKEAFLRITPMGRLGTCAEMGAIASFLCSDDASFITGETIIASGGVPSRL